MKIRVTVTLACLLALSACATGSADYVRGDLRAQRRVLVAGTQSEFKHKVVDRVVQRLGEKDYFFSIVGLDGLNTEDLASYGAIVLVYSLPGGRMDGRVRAFINANKGNPKVIVFYSKGAEGPEPEDAVSSRNAADRRTAVTLLANAERYADLLVTQIEKRFP